MRNRIALVAACSIVLAILGNSVVNTRAQHDPSAAPVDATSSNARSSIDRGMYVVHHVAMCIYCHTPKDADGQLDEQQLLLGAPMPVESPFPRVKWAFQCEKLPACRAAGRKTTWCGFCKLASRRPAEPRSRRCRRFG